MSRSGESAEDRFDVTAFGFFFTFFFQLYGSDLLPVLAVLSDVNVFRVPLTK